MDSARRQWGETPWSPPNATYTAAGSASALIGVAIIGGGLTGASTAYHLAKRGIGATVFEAGDIGDGASGRTGGLVLEATAAGPLAEVTTCLSELSTLAAAEAIDCDLRLPGCWEIKHGDSSSHRMLPWRDAGKPVYIAKTTTGGTVDPVRLLNGILSAAVRVGAEIRQRTAVERIMLQPRPAIEVGGRTIYPEYIVAAANAWLPALLPEAVKLRSSLTFAVATQPLDSGTIEAIGLGAHIPFYTADLPYLWGRTMTDGRLIFGAGLVFGSPAQLEAASVKAGDSRASLMRLQDQVRRLHPKLAQVQFSASWGGPIAFARDLVPLLGLHPSCPKVIVAGGYSGHGVALSVRIGQLISRAIADGVPLPDWGRLER